MSVTPVRETIASGSGEPRYGRQTLRSINCPLVSAVTRPTYYVPRTAETGIP
jgi:hypothetical protein